MIGETFSAEKFGDEFTMTVRKNDKDEVVFFSNYLKEEMNNPTAAFQRAFEKYSEEKGLSRQACTISGWSTPKNKNGQNLYDVIKEKMKKK